MTRPRLCRPLLHASLAFLLSLPLVAVADPPPGKEARKAEREQAREQRKSEREWAKEQRAVDKAWRKSEREWAKDQRHAWREQQKALRKARQAEARSGWYDGERWRDYDAGYRYRGEDWVALRRYPAPRDWAPPPGAVVRAYEPGMQLPGEWYRQNDIIVHDPYGLPPPPPRHQWVQVDDDAVLVALATGLVADFVYDLFE